MKFVSKFKTIDAINFLHLFKGKKHLEEKIASFHISDLDPEDLSALRDEYRVSMFAEAGK